MGKIGQAFTADARTVLLIDEIDKADTDFQDDMLDVLDQMEFDIIEIDKTIPAAFRPVIIITSNAKKDLSDPFLGRCNFHHIAFPDPEMMNKIILVHFPDIDSNLLENAITAFYAVRDFGETGFGRSRPTLILNPNNWKRAICPIWVSFLKRARICIRPKAWWVVEGLTKRRRTQLLFY
jgi:hypothetical protein